MARTKGARNKPKEAKAIDQSIEEVDTLAEEFDAPTDKRLTQQQLRKLEVTERDVTNAKLMMAVEEQALKNLNLQMAYLELAIEKQKLILSAKSAEYESLKTRYTAISREVFKEHGIAGDKVSYDSETGLIVP